VLTVSWLPSEAPPGLVAATDVYANTEPALGVLVSHFTTTSTPVLRSVTVSAEGSVDVEVSESVIVPGGATGLDVSPIGGGTPCAQVRYTNPGPLYEVAFQCESAVFSGLHVHLHGLKSAAGTPFGVFRVGACDEASVVDTGDFEQDLSPPATLTCGVGCWGTPIIEHGPSATTTVMP
jgi:hypothetical protein